MALFRFKSQFTGWRWVVDVPDAAMKKIQRDYDTVSRCISLLKNCALRKALTGVKSQNHCLEKKKEVHWGEEPWQWKHRWTRNKRGSVLNIKFTSESNFSKGSDLPALPSNTWLAKEAAPVRRMSLKNTRNPNCTRTREGTGCKWDWETPSQPLFSSGLQ